MRRILGFSRKSRNVVPKTIVESVTREKKSHCFLFIIIIFFSLFLDAGEGIRVDDYRGWRGLGWVIREVGRDQSPRKMLFN